MVRPKHYAARVSGHLANGQLAKRPLAKGSPTASAPGNRPRKLEGYLGGSLCNGEHTGPIRRRRGRGLVAIFVTLADKLGNTSDTPLRRKFFLTSGDKIFLMKLNGYH